MTNQTVDEDALLALRQPSGRVPTESVGRFLAATDHSLLSQVSDMVLATWRRWRPEMPELKVGRRYHVTPGRPFAATLAVVIPDDPDHPTGVGWYGLWQVRTPLGQITWYVWDDAWIDCGSVRPVDC